MRLVSVRLFTPDGAGFVAGDKEARLGFVRQQATVAFRAAVARLLKSQSDSGFWPGIWVPDPGFRLRAAIGLLAVDPSCRRALRPLACELIKAVTEWECCTTDDLLLALLLAQLCKTPKRRLERTFYEWTESRGVEAGISVGTKIFLALSFGLPDAWRKEVALHLAQLANACTSDQIGTVLAELSKQIVASKMELRFGSAFSKTDFLPLDHLIARLAEGIPSGKSYAWLDMKPMGGYRTVLPRPELSLLLAVVLARFAEKQSCSTPFSLNEIKAELFRIAVGAGPLPDYADPRLETALVCLGLVASGVPGWHARVHRAVRFLRLRSFGQEALDRASNQQSFPGYNVRTKPTLMMWAAQLFPTSDIDTVVSRTLEVLWSNSYANGRVEEPNADRTAAYLPLGPKPFINRGDTHGNSALVGTSASSAWHLLSDALWTSHSNLGQAAQCGTLGRVLFASQAILQYADQTLLGQDQQRRFALEWLRNEGLQALDRNGRLVSIIAAAFALKALSVAGMAKDAATLRLVELILHNRQSDWGWQDCSSVPRSVFSAALGTGATAAIVLDGLASWLNETSIPPDASKCDSFPSRAAQPLGEVLLGQHCSNSEHFQRAAA